MQISTKYRLEALFSDDMPNNMIQELPECYLRFPVESREMDGCQQILGCPRNGYD